MKKSFIETSKFVLRIVILVGVPAILAEVVKEKPEYGVYVGIVLAIIDKYIHHLPNEYKGLLPF